MSIGHMTLYIYRVDRSYHLYKLNPVKNTNFTFELSKTGLSGLANRNIRFSSEMKKGKLSCHVIKNKVI